MYAICFLRAWEQELEAEVNQILFSPQMFLEIFEIYLRAI